MLPKTLCLLLLAQSPAVQPDSLTKLQEVLSTNVWYLDADAPRPKNSVRYSILPEANNRLNLTCQYLEDGRQGSWSILFSPGDVEAILTEPRSTRSKGKGDHAEVQVSFKRGVKGRDGSAPWREQPEWELDVFLGARDYETGDRIAELFSALLTPMQPKLVTGDKIGVYKSSSRIRLESQDRKAEEDYLAKQRLEDERRRTSLKAPSRQARTLMKAFADEMEVYGVTLLETGKNEVSVARYDDTSFTLQDVYSSYTSQFSQRDTVTIHWHRVERVTFYRSPSSGPPFVRIALSLPAKQYRKGDFKNEVREASVVEISCASGFSAERVARLLVAALRERGSKADLIDARLR